MIAMPAATAAAPYLGHAARLLGGLGDRLAARRSRRGAADAEQAHADRRDYCEYEITHADSSLCMTREYLPSIFFAVKARVPYARALFAEQTFTFVQPLDQWRQRLLKSHELYCRRWIMSGLGMCAR
jgi:hypothetical protein